MVFVVFVIFVVSEVSCFTVVILQPQLHRCFTPSTWQLPAKLGRSDRVVAWSQLVRRLRSLEDGTGRGQVMYCHRAAQLRVMLLLSLV